MKTNLIRTKLEPIFSDKLIDIFNLSKEEIEKYVEQREQQSE